MYKRDDEYRAKGNSRFEKALNYERQAVSLYFFQKRLIEDCSYQGLIKYYLDTKPLTELSDIFSKMSPAMFLAVYQNLVALTALGPRKHKCYGSNQTSTNNREENWVVPDWK